ncbi:MAG: hypothetical protein ILO53_06055 [Clostridia bacterium]|nr:hypothetical protein [Clostridia bacterium]
METLKEKRNKILEYILIGMGILILLLAIVIEIVILKKGGLSGKKDNEPLPTQGDIAAATEAPTEAPTEEPWIPVNEEGNTIETRFNPPKGYTRVSVEPGSFGEYLRKYPLKPYGSKALIYSGAESDTASTLGVFAQADPLVKNQQCADTVMMLYGQYLYAQGRHDEIVFNFSSGFKCDFSTWAKGYRDVVNGRDVQWVLSTDREDVKENDYSYENLYKYLKEVYVYANTDSMAMQYSRKSINDVKPGDVFIATYAELKGQALLISEEAADTVSYGHALVVADMAVNSDGEKVFLLIEGTTPATECAVVENPDGVSFEWFKIAEDGTFVKSKSGIKWKSSWLYSLDGK